MFLSLLPTGVCVELCVLQRQRYLSLHHHFLSFSSLFLCHLFLFSLSLTSLLFAISFTCSLSPKPSHRVRRKGKASAQLNLVPSVFVVQDNSSLTINVLFVLQKHNSKALIWNWNVECWKVPQQLLCLLAWQCWEHYCFLHGVGASEKHEAPIKRRGRDVLAWKGSNVFWRGLNMAVFEHARCSLITLNYTVKDGLL